MLNLIYDQLYFMYILSVFPTFFNVSVRQHCFPQFTQRLKTGILDVALGWAFQFFQIDERDKKLEFSGLGSVW